MMERDPILTAKELGFELRKSIALTLASQGDDGVAFLKACDEIDKLRVKGDPPLQSSGQIGPETLDMVD